MLCSRGLLGLGAQIFLNTSPLSCLRAAPASSVQARAGSEFQTSGFTSVWTPNRRQTTEQHTAHSECDNPSDSGSWMHSGAGKRTQDSKQAYCFQQNLRVSICFLFPQRVVCIHQPQESLTEFLEKKLVDAILGLLT